MSLGAADFPASMGMQTTGIGGAQEACYMAHQGAKHWSDPWNWAQTAIAAAFRTHGVLPAGGPFGDFSDDDVITLSDAAVTEARGILAAMEAASARGEGAKVCKGRLVDIASIKQAEGIVRQAETIAR
jgi:malyl-CoA/(S)-citramalyl-CoA lyase